MDHAKNLKRICFIQPYDTHGSIENYLSMIINDFNEIGSYDITFLCPEGKKADSLCRKINSDVKIIRFNSRQSGLRLLIYFIRFFKEFNPSVIHINDLYTRAMVAANICGIKNKILTFHTPTLDLIYGWKGKLMWKLAFRKDWNIVATSEGLKNVIAVKYNLAEEKITVIHYGLDKDEFKKKINREEIKRKLNISEGSFVITNVARLCPQKAHDVLIKSIALLPQEILEHSIVLLAGEGESEKSIINLISDLKLKNKIHLLGYRDDIPDILACTDIFVLSSVFEGACFAIMEAMAMGIPIIATDVEGVKDTVSNGETAILVPPNRPEKIAQAIEMLFKDKAKREIMGIRGKERFERNFTKEKMLENTRFYYSNVIKREQ